LGGVTTRPGGFYELEEFEIPSGVVAWQYYVYDANGVSKSQESRPGTGPILVPGFSPPIGSGAGFTPFDEKELTAGDQVIWRMVAILRTPNVGS